MKTGSTFSIDDTTEALLSHLNSTTELEGEGRKPAVDLKLRVGDAGDLIAGLHPSLRSFLYKAAEDGEGDLADQGSDVPSVLRFPQIGSFKWDLELERYQLEIDLGLGGKSNMVLGEVKVTDFLVEPKAGGIVDLTMKVRAHPDEKQAGKLYAMQARSIWIVLTPPDDAQEPLDGVH